MSRSLFDLGNVEYEWLLAAGLVSKLHINNPGSWKAQANGYCKVFVSE